MADYHSILTKTIAGLPANTPENRKLVYAKARTAIDRQLRALNPPPSEEAIAKQMAALEAAIRKIDAEYGAVAPSAPVAPRPQPAVQPRAQPTPQPTPQQATQQTGVSPRYAPAQAPGAGVPPQGIRPVAQQAPTQVSRPAPQAPVAPTPRADPQAALRREPRSAPPAYDASLDSVSDFDEPARIAPGRGRRSALDQRNGAKRSGGIAIAVVGVLALLILAGGGYLLWQNRAPLMALLGGGASTTGQPAENGAASPAGNDNAAADDAAEKEEARLGDDGREIPPEPLPDANPARDVTQNATDGTGSQPGVPEVITPEQATNPDDTTDSEETGEDVVNPVAEEGETGDAVAPASSGAASPAIAQKAFLYEEGIGASAASRDNAAIIWSLGEESPAEGLPPEAVIKGTLDVPGRGLTMDLLIRRNVDDALSASHIIELVFKAPADFSGGSVDTLARFVMKSSEQARGEPLVAVPVKINTGYFMIALNNLQQARESNEKLLRDSSWIDIPLGYTTGRRALVTLEKGAIGDKVFRDAFEDWKNR